MTEIASSGATASTDRARPPGFRWVLVVLLLIGGVVNYLDRSTLSVANTTIAQEFGLGPIEMGLLLSAFAWPYAIANLPAGYLVDRFGPKWLFAGAAAAWSLVGMVTAAAHSFGALYALRVALGIAESPFFTAGLSVNQRWFGRSERALPVALVNTGSQIANAIAPPLLTFLMLTMSWRGMFLVIGALGFVVAGVWLRVYRDPTLREHALITSADSEPASPDTDPSETVPWTRLFRETNTWFMVLGAFGIFYTVWLYLTWLPSYLQTALGFSLQASGWLAALPFLCGVVGVVFGGWLSGRLIGTGVATVTARKIPIVGGAVLAAAAVLPAAFLRSTPAVIALLCVGYFAAQIPIGVLWTLAADLAPPNQVASLGAIQNFGGFIGAATAPVVTGALLAATGGSFTPVFVVGGAMLLIGAVAYGFFVREPAS